jgi:hypothetical protein
MERARLGNSLIHFNTPHSRVTGEEKVNMWTQTEKRKSRCGHKGEKRKSTRGHKGGQQ